MTHAYPKKDVDMIEQTNPQNSAETAQTLSQALPYMQRYDNAVVVIKLGGHAMGSDEAMETFAQNIVLMRQVGINPVIINGGGPMINQMLSKLGIRSTFVNGKRVTDSATMEVVEMVLSGSVNKRIVQAINRMGGSAVGLSGKDANLIICEQLGANLGFVGEPTVINPRLLRTLFNDDMIPVISPLGSGKNGETYNINGDTAAGAIAAALNADRLLLLTDVDGVEGADGQIITELGPEKIDTLIAEGTITGGMIPKTQTALNAIKEGVKAVVILNGRKPNACLLELFTKQGAGTLIRSNLKAALL